MIIKFYGKNVYGKTNYYFAEDNETTRAIQGLTGCRTITERQSDLLTTLGVEWEQVIDPSLTR